MLWLLTEIWPEPFSFEFAYLAIQLLVIRASQTFYCFQFTLEAVRKICPQSGGGRVVQCKQGRGGSSDVATRTGEPVVSFLLVCADVFSGRPLTRSLSFSLVIFKGLF